MNLSAVRPLYIIEHTKDTVMDKLNILFSNKYLRMFLLLLCGVLINYVLQPVPKIMLETLQNSVVLKFIILFMTGMISVYPLDGDELYHIMLGSILLLILFKMLREYDLYKKNTKHETYKNNYYVV